MISNSKIYRLVNLCLCIVFLFINIPLILVSFASTTYMNQGWNEQTFLIKDNYVVTAIATIGVILICYAIYSMFGKKKVSLFTDRNAKCILIGILVIQEVLGILLIFLLQLEPRGDQEMMLDIVSEFMTGNYNSVLPGQYLSANHQQFGWFWYSFLVTKIFGEYRDWALQLINLNALVVFEYYLSKVVYQIWQKRSMQIMTCILCVLFFPLMLFVTYEYGNLLGLACSLAAISNLISFLKQGSVRFGTGYVINIVLASLIKNNYLIFFIGTILIILLYCMAAHTEWKKIFVLVIACILYIFLNYACKAALEVKSDITIIDGIPSICYVDMGLQENEAHAGWYDSQYTWGIYCETHFNRENASRLAMNDLKERVEFWKQNPKDALNFFVRKNASQWNQPTFQGWWILQNRKTKNEWLPGIQKFMSIQCGKQLESIYNIVHLLVFAMAVIYVMINGKRMTIYEWILPAIFIGGYMFHMVWEAKGQYTISYFVLLIPYAVAGMRKLFHNIDCIKREEKRFWVKKLPVLGFCSLMGALCAVVFYWNIWTTITNDKESFSRCYEAETVKGNWLLNAKIPVVIDTYHDENTIMLDNGLFLGVSEKNGSAEIVMLEENDDADRIRWKITKTEDGTGYYIIYGGDLYLTLNAENEFILGTFDEKTQKWILYLPNL